MRIDLIGKPHPLSPTNFKGGGSSTTVVQNTPPSAAASADAVNAWVNAMPQVYETQFKYSPLEAAQQVQLAQQYALPLAQAYQGANEVLNPGYTKLSTSLADQALEGSTATTMPEWMRKQYQSDFNANLGTNAGSPIGADYVSRGMQNQLFNQQSKYRDMGLSLIGRQPLSVAQPIGTSNYVGNFKPENVMNYLGNFGTKTSTTTGPKSGGLFGGLFG